MLAKELNDLHLGRTVYVVGAGPQLCDLSSDQIEALAFRPSIGLNGVPHKVPTSFFLSGYMCMCLLAMQEYQRLGRVDDTVILNLKIGKVSHFWHQGFYRVQKQRFDPEHGLPSGFQSRPRLCTNKNGALAATHLAHILGASKIAFVGVEFSSGVHYYHVDQKINERIYKDVLKLRKRSPRHHRTMARLEQQFRPRPEPVDRNRESAFLPGGGVDKILKTLWHYKMICQERGVEFVNTAENSRLGDIGIPYKPLSEVLDEET